MEQKGITLIALVITIIILLILAGISIATLTGENGVLQKAEMAKKQTEIENAKEQAKLDIAAWVADKLEKQEDATLNDSIVKEILTDKSYVKEGKPGDSSFNTQKSEYEISYSVLYTAKPKEEVHFTIDGGPYVTDKGMTWKEFLETQEGENLEIFRERVIIVAGSDDYGDAALGYFADCVCLEGEIVRPFDEIIEADYTIEKNVNIGW